MTGTEPRTNGIGWEQYCKQDDLGPKKWRLQEQGLADYNDELVRPVSGCCHFCPEPAASFGGALSISTCPRDPGIALVGVQFSEHTWKNSALRHTATVTSEENVLAYRFCNAWCIYAILVPGGHRALGSLEVMLMLPSRHHREVFHGSRNLTCVVEC
jgi:hypothetical protein